VPIHTGRGQSEAQTTHALQVHNRPACLGQSANASDQVVLGAARARHSGDATELWPGKRLPSRLLAEDAAGGLSLSEARLHTRESASDVPRLLCRCGLPGGSRPTVGSASRVLALGLGWKWSVRRSGGGEVCEDCGVWECDVGVRRILWRRRVRSGEGRGGKRDWTVDKDGKAIRTGPGEEAGGVCGHEDTGV